MAIVRDRSTIRARPDAVLQHLFVNTYPTTDPSTLRISRPIPSTSAHRSAHTNRRSCNHKKRQDRNFRLDQIRENRSYLVRKDELVSRCHIVPRAIGHDVISWWRSCALHFGRLRELEENWKSSGKKKDRAREQSKSGGGDLKIEIQVEFRRRLLKYNSWNYSEKEGIYKGLDIFWYLTNPKWLKCIYTGFRYLWWNNGGSI